MNQPLIITLCFVLPCLLTTLGAAFIFFFNKSSPTLTIITISLASGIMLSASIWSLLVPAQEDAQQNLGNLAFLPVVIGFALGGLFMLILDFFSEKMFKNEKNTQKSQTFTLFTAISVHNIPEGLSVGFALGTALATQNGLLSALMFAVGIAIQNLPEGLATAIPLNNCLNNRKKSFFLAFLACSQ